MKIKFYGHQTWEVATEFGTVLFDPLIRPYFGASAESFCAIYPFRIAPQPTQVTAIFLSHEHGDHFCVESLASLDRHVPVYTGTLMPASIDWCLCELGFEVRKFESNSPIDLDCGIRVTPFHCAEETPFWERRVYQFVVSDGSSAFYLAVDGGVSHDTLGQLRATGTQEPGLFAVSNNSQITWLDRRSALQNDRQDPIEDFRKNGLFALSVYSQLMAECLPELDDIHIAVCGGGFVKGFEDIHPHPIAEHWRVTPHIAKFSSDRISAPQPGTVYCMSDNKVIGTELDPRFEHLSLADFKRRFGTEACQGRRGYYSLTAHVLPDPKQLIEKAGQMLDDFWLSNEGLKLFRFCVERGLPCTISLTLDGSGGASSTTLLKDIASGERSLSDAFGTLSIRIHDCDFFALTEGLLDIWELTGSHISIGFPEGADSIATSFLYSYYGEQVNQSLARQFVMRRLEKVAYAS